MVALETDHQVAIGPDRHIVERFGFHIGMFTGMGVMFGCEAAGDELNLDQSEALGL